MLVFVFSKAISAKMMCVPLNSLVLCFDMPKKKTHLICIQFAKIVLLVHKLAKLTRMI